MSKSRNHAESPPDIRQIIRIVEAELMRHDQAHSSNAPAEASNPEPLIGEKKDSGSGDGAPDEASKPSTATPSQPGHSTGPRTAKGKAITSKNAVKYGFLSTSIIIQSGRISENAWEFKQLFSWYRRHFNPQGPAETHQLEIAVAALWRYRRALVAEMDQVASLTGEVGKERDEVIGHLKGMHLRIMFEGPPLDLSDVSGTKPSLEELEKSIKRHQAYTEASDFAEKFLAVLDRSSVLDPREVEKHCRYESHLLRIYYRAMNELERLQRMRHGDKVPAPVVLNIEKDPSS